MWPPGCHWSFLCQVWPHLYPRLERRRSPSSTCFRTHRSGLAKVMLLGTAVNTWRPRGPSWQSETLTEITHSIHIGFLGKMLAKAKIWAYLGLWCLFWGSWCNAKVRLCGSSWGWLLLELSRAHLWWSSESTRRKLLAGVMSVMIMSKHREANKS